MKENDNSKWEDDARYNLIRLGQELVKKGKTEYKPIIETLKSEDNEELNIAALYALQDIGDENAVDAIIKLYDSSKNENA